MVKGADKVDQGRTVAETLADSMADVSEWALAPAIALAVSAAADDIIDTAAPHGYAAGEVVRFPTLTGGAGLVTDRFYYVIAANLAAQTFQVSETLGGAAKLFTTDITAGTVATLATPGTGSGSSSKLFLGQSDAEADAGDHDS